MKIQRRAPNVTINDVAKHAGVSVGTVSRALNGFSNISPANLKRVQEAVSHLGYQKCESAGLLVSRKNGSRARTGNIGIVFADMGPQWMNHPLMLAYTLGVEEVCRERGFHVLMEMTLDLQAVPRCIRDGKVDGLLVKASRRAPSFLQDMDESFPVVGMGFNDPSCPIHQVAADSRGAGWCVTDSLWERGHRRIAFVCINAEHPTLFARFQGYESFLRRNGSYRADLVVMEQRPELRGQPEEVPPDMSAVVDALWSAESAPTAIVTANDWMARGLYCALFERGLKVPSDVSVVGFDNTPAMCGMMEPPLTSFDMSFTPVARTATQRLIDQIDNPRADVVRAIEFVRGRMVERASVQSLTLAQDSSPLDHRAAQLL